MFQLAELKWEEAKSQFLSEMAAFNAAVEKCNAAKNERPRLVPARRRSRGSI